MATFQWQRNAVFVIAHIPTPDGQGLVDTSIEEVHPPVYCGAEHIPERQTVKHHEAVRIFINAECPKYMYQGLSHCLACCYALRREAGIEIGRAE